MLKVSNIRKSLQHGLARLGWNFKVQWAALGLTWVVVAGVMLYNAWSEYRGIEQQEWHWLQSQNRMAEQLLYAQIESADAALRTVLEGLDRWRVGPEDFAPFAHEHLQRVKHMIPGVRSFVVLDAHGVCRLSNHTQLLGQNFSERVYFQRAMQAKDGTRLHVSPPFQHHLGGWTVAVSRSIRDAQGHAQGVVAAVLAPDYFQNLMRQLRYAPDMHLALVHAEGHFYVSSRPEVQWQEINFQQSSTLFRDHVFSGRGESVYSDSQFFTPEQSRLVALRNLGLDTLGVDHGFVAAASRDKQQVFAGWLAGRGAALECHLGGVGAVQFVVAVAVPALGGPFACAQQGGPGRAA